MTRHARGAQVFAICLSALAGYVDAIGFLSLGGFFVSFMSGNSTRLSVGLAAGSPNPAVAAGLIAAFVAGVVLATLVGRIPGEQRARIILLLIAALLALGSILALLGDAAAAFAVIAAAMGAENTVFERDGEVSLGVTYMTGTLVKLGQRIASALAGGDRLAWAPYLFLWLGLVAGALAGAAAYPRLGPQSLWLAAVAALVLAVIAPKMDRGPVDPAS